MRKIQGFTLIEVMVTVAIVAIIAAIGAPSLKSFLDGNKIRTEAQRVAGVLSLARSHSISNNQWVVVSRSAVAGRLDLTAFMDDGANDYVYDDTDGDTLVMQSMGLESNLDYGANAEITTNGAVLFNAQGRLTNPTNANLIAANTATITICDKDHTVGRQVSVNPIGRVTVSDLDNPGANCL